VTGSHGRGGGLIIAPVPLPFKRSAEGTKRRTTLKSRKTGFAAASAPMGAGAEVVTKFEGGRRAKRKVGEGCSPFCRRGKNRRYRMKGKEKERRLSSNLEHSRGNLGLGKFKRLKGGPRAGGWAGCLESLGEKEHKCSPFFGGLGVRNEKWLSLDMRITECPIHAGNFQGGKVNISEGGPEETSE